MAKLRKTTYHISSGAVSFRAALLADLHDRNPDQTIAILREDPPDLILLAGDLYESPPRNPVSDRNAVLLLDGIAGLAPIIYCRGNHDHTPTDRTTEALRRAGATELCNSDILLRGIRIGGLRSALYAGGIPDLAFLDRFSAMDGWKLLLCHHPEYYPLYLRDRAIDLTVSGHAHGGQWCFFGHAIWAPGQGFFPKYASGVSEGRLVVSRGLANSVPIPRFGVPTEVVYLEVGKPQNGERCNKS